MEEAFEEAKRGILMVISQSDSISLMQLGNPIYIHGLSAFAHLVLLLVLSVCWGFKRINKNEGLSHSRFLLYKPTVFSCLGLSLFDFVLCVINYLFWYKTGWSNENLVIQFDLALRTLAWVSITVYLYTRFSKSRELKFPFWLRAWWGLFFVMSCSSLVFDLVLHRKDETLPTHFWVLDVGSVIGGLLFLCAGVFGKREEEKLIREPLLNGSNGEGTCSLTKDSGDDNLSPLSKASLFSILTFSWISPLIALGSKKTLNLEDVPKLANADSVYGVYPIFKNNLDSYSGEVSSMKLAKALFFTTWMGILGSGLFSLINSCSAYVGPYLIDSFVQYLNGHRDYKDQGYFLVSVFLSAKLAECLSQRYLIFILQRTGVRIRSALVASIYRKGQTLSSQSRQVHTTGEIINFITVDSERIGTFCWYLHTLWLVPIQVTLALSILYKNLGLATVFTFIATVLVMLANVPLGKLQKNFQEKLMESKDGRMKRTSEILQNMRILKLQGWEMKFLSKISELRKNEEHWLKRFMYTSAMTSFIFWGAPTFVSVVTFGACMLMGIPLESGKVLSALATFRILQEPIYMLPQTISMVAQTKVSLDRIAAFLCLEDLKPDLVEKLPRESEIAIEMKDGSFSWDPSLPNPTLKDLNFQIFPGMRVAVCGTVGSGKSSLLSCILGEVPKLSGSVKLSGTKAYVAQSPWIQSGTIEENILFGKHMDRESYERVLEACSLKKDLEILSFGDKTVIGERGINLSGGQKQRIQIARALYQDADIYLFDDPFSAVDAHTGTHLFKECLLGLLGSKTVIFVTHQVEFLPSADLILVMKDGKVTQSGKYDEILSSGTDFMELVGAHKKALSALSSVEEGSSEHSRENDNIENGETVEDKEEDKEGNEKSDEIVGPKGQLVQEEEREKGRVGLEVYWKYITMAYGGALVPFILLGQIFFLALQIGSNYWMTWATPMSKDVKSTVDNSTLIIVYVALAVGSSLCVLLRTTVLATAAYKTATLLFEKMHARIFRAPMSFFDSTPSGRILSRASTDQSAADMSIPYLMAAFSFSVVQLLGIILLMTQVAWQIFIIFIPVIATCIYYQQYYLPAARELARLVGVCKAPLVQHCTESISGSTTIKSFDQESRFMDKNLQLNDSYSQPDFHADAAMEWLCIRLDILSNVTFASCLIFLISMPVGFIDPALAGLAVTYGLNLNMIQTLVIWHLSGVENKIISIERILQYSSIPIEPALVVEDHRPASDWPTNGEIVIRDLQVRYAPHMPLVLRGMTCTFPGGMKTGIVGRTGSGKSTLIQALFRIVEPTAGQILVDGVDITIIGLHDLRSRLSIIPQDPTMFEGTVRSNLDPLEEYTDEQIWVALDKCQLGEEVRNKEGKLDSSVTENGENWSMGQRQLVCLGRVLLKKSKILVLDEATASVDTATDNLIQLTLRQHFADCTVITIAHRITSVLDSDMVLLLDQGLIEEYDSPSKLLEDKSSSFAKLVSEYTVRSNSSF